MFTKIDVKRKTVWDVEIFRFSGELDETNTDKTFSEMYKVIGNFEWKKIVFDFSGAEYICQKWISYIMDIFSNIEDNNGLMYLCWVTNEDVLDTFQLIGITTIIPTVKSESDALAEMKTRKK